MYNELKNLTNTDLLRCLAQAAPLTLLNELLEKMTHVVEERRKQEYSQQCSSDA